MGTRIKSKPPQGGRNKGGRNVGSEPRDKESLGLRIIGGRLRGSSLVYAGDNRVRPMKDRVREAVFNLIGPAAQGKHVIDLFAGTGALALEAISRGAVFATLIELHLPTAKNARTNIENLALTEVCQLISSDAFYWTKTRENFQAYGPWLVFVSPPYEFFVSKKREMLEMLEILHETAPSGSLIVLEADKRFDFASLPFEIPEKKRRSYPPAEIGIVVKE
ncbi:MAG: RsmD family RNA methyltransferase [Planctomycetaceae bacterium]|nr:RsmD family RNA methyltransferase [Planctomycetaceae bacterium]